MTILISILIALGIVSGCLILVASALFLTLHDYKWKDVITDVIAFVCGVVNVGVALHLISLVEQVK